MSGKYNKEKAFQTAHSYHGIDGKGTCYQELGAAVYELEVILLSPTSWKSLQAVSNKLLTKSEGT